MRKACISAIFLCAATYVFAIDFSGVTQTPIRIDADASTGLEGIYVLPTTIGVTMSYTAKSAADVHWYRFSNLGAAYAEEIASSRSGSTVTTQAQSGDMGYIIEEGSTRIYYWVVDYSAHQLEMRALTVGTQEDCNRTILSFDGSAAEIPYYNINGRRLVLSRELEVEYSTLKFDATSFTYDQTTTTETLDAIGSTFAVTAPLCDTQFHLSGDRFLRAWGDEDSIESETVVATAVDAQTRATQEARDNDNEQKDNSNEGYGGSAPCEITFEAAVSDAAIFTEWQISRDPEFGINENTFNELSFTYTFRENGATYVRFVANNADGTCEYISETYQINIGESRLDIPNAFSPEASPGINDEWKVSYKSLISFECHIFNKWGKQLFSTTNPAKGWDGKYGGKYVPSGVYYYVIKAEGADDIKYKKSGDINIIKFNEGSGTTGGSAQQTE